MPASAPKSALRPVSVPAVTSTEAGPVMQSSARANTAKDTFTSGAIDASRHARTTGPRGVAPVRPSLLSTTAVKNAVVVGAGPAGLLAALELVQNGASVTLIDQRDAYTRPIHWSVRADLLHRIAETCPNVLAEVMDRLGAIESLERIDSTKTKLTSEELSDLATEKPGRKVSIGPEGLRFQQRGPALPSSADAQYARYGGRHMLTSPSIGQILTVDLENILFAELERLAARPASTDQARVTIMRNHRCDLAASPDKAGFQACTAYEVREKTAAIGRATFQPTGKRVDLGTPDLVVCSDGANSQMRTLVGIKRTHVSRPARFIAASIAQADFSEHAPNGGLARRRYAELVDPADGSIHGVRQVVLGITKAPQSWVLVEVPPFIDVNDKLAVDAFFHEHAGLLLGRTPAQMRDAKITWGPNPFTMQQFISATAVKGENVIFMGDSVGNAHFLTSGGVMTASVPHIFSLEKLLANLADGVPRWLAFDRYNRWALSATRAWLKLGHKEFGRQGAHQEPFEEAMGAALERLQAQA